MAIQGMSTAGGTSPPDANIPKSIRERTAMGITGIARGAGHQSTVFQVSGHMRGENLRMRSKLDRKDTYLK